MWLEHHSRDEKLQLKKRSDRNEDTNCPLSSVQMCAKFGWAWLMTSFLSTSKTLKPLKAAFQVTQRPQKENHVLAIPLYFDAKFRPLWNVLFPFPVFPFTLCCLVKQGCHENNLLKNQRGQEGGRQGEGTEGRRSRGWVWETRKQS